MPALGQKPSPRIRAAPSVPGAAFRSKLDAGGIRQELGALGAAFVTNPGARGGDTGRERAEALPEARDALVACSNNCTMHVLPGLYLRSKPLAMVSSIRATVRSQ